MFVRNPNWDFDKQYCEVYSVKYTCLVYKFAEPRENKHVGEFTFAFKEFLFLVWLVDWTTGYIMA